MTVTLTLPIWLFAALLAALIVEIILGMLRTYFEMKLFRLKRDEPVEPLAYTQMLYRNRLKEIDPEYSEL